MSFRRTARALYFIHLFGLIFYFHCAYC